MRSENTVGGNYRTTRNAIMAAYDKLPPAARKALANAVADWAPQPFLKRYKRGYCGFLTGDDIAAQVRRADRELLAKWEIERAAGIGAYNGNTPDLAALLSFATK